MDSMPSTQNQITTIPFSGLINWSVRYLKENRLRYRKEFKLYRIGDFLDRNRKQIKIEDDVSYRRVTVKLYNKGVIERDVVKGNTIGTKRQFVVSEGQFIMSKIDARNAAFGLVPKELDGAVVTADFLSYNVDKTKIDPQFLTLLTSTNQFVSLCQSASSGTTGRQRVQESTFLNFQIPLPSLIEQQRIVASYVTKIALAQTQQTTASRLESQIEEYLFRELGINRSDNSAKRGLHLVRFKDLIEWGTNKILRIDEFKSSKYSFTSLEQNVSLFVDIIRGKSPIYGKSDKLILNQKCNRWNDIELVHAKTVNKSWANSVNQAFYTKVGDVLINSTGEGTIGRASVVTKDFEGLLFDSHMLCLRLFKDKINPLFYTYLFNSSYGQFQVTQLKSAQSTKQTELGVGNLKKIVFPLPPIEIQNKLANKISTMKEEIKRLYNQAEANQVSAIKEFEQEIFYAA